MKHFWKSERGVAFVETAATLPFLLGLIFLLYDSLVIGYDWMALHRVAQETLRVASLGPHKDDTTNTEYRSRAEAAGQNAYKVAFGLADGTTMSSGMAHRCGTPGRDCTSDPVTVTEWDSPDSTDNDPYLVIRVQKTILLSPAGKLLTRALSSETTDFSLSVSVLGRVESEEIPTS